MKLEKVSVVIKEKIYVGLYESIEPQVEISAVLEPGDDPKVCMDELHKILSPSWAKHALVELGWVAMRRKTDKEKLSQFDKLTAGARIQIKGLVK